MASSVAHVSWWSAPSRIRVGRSACCTGSTPCRRSGSARVSSPRRTSALAAKTTRTRRNESSASSNARGPRRLNWLRWYSSSVATNSGSRGSMPTIGRASPAVAASNSRPSSKTTGAMSLARTTWSPNRRRRMAATVSGLMSLAVAVARPRGCLRRREDVTKPGEQLEQRGTRSRAVNTDAAATRTGSDEWSGVGCRSGGILDEHG